MSSSPLPDVLWDALVEMFHPRGPNKLQRGRLQAAHAALKEVSATPEQVKERFAAWPFRFKCTPTALAKYWDECEPKVTVQPGQPSKQENAAQAAEYRAGAKRADDIRDRYNEDVKRARKWCAGLSHDAYVSARAQLMEGETPENMRTWFKQNEDGLMRQLWINAGRP